MKWKKKKSTDVNGERVFQGMITRDLFPSLGHQAISMQITTSQSFFFLLTLPDPKDTEKEERKEAGDGDY